MKTFKFTHIDTGGHGYYVVPKTTFIELGGDPTKISNFSGHNLRNLYLEEDCDATYFFNVLKENSVPFEIETTYNYKFSISHNYRPEMFNFKFETGDRLRINGNIPATVHRTSSKIFVKTDNQFVFKIPISNPFRYVNPF